jgi:hypothetical protein
MIDVLGEAALATQIPQVTIAVGPLIANVEAEVAALLNFSVTLPSIELDLDVNAQIAAGLNLNLALGVTPPGIDLQLELTLALLLELQLQLQLLLELKNAMLASVHLYEYTGQVGSFGTELQAELSGGLPGGGSTDEAFAVVLVATAAPAIAALKSLFKTP